MPVYRYVLYAGNWLNSQNTYLASKQEFTVKLCTYYNNVLFRLVESWMNLVWLPSKVTFISKELIFSSV
jgi:hypothetical protein